MTEKIDLLLDKIKKFRDERDWKKFHNHKDMAISIVLEASELLNIFNGKKKTSSQKPQGQKEIKYQKRLQTYSSILLNCPIPLE